MLRVERVTKCFGGLMAVNDVSFNLAKVGITGLIGPNGSGKTTLFHLITAFYALDEGRIFFDGKEISRRSPHTISRMGLIRTFQQTRILPFLSTIDNLIAAVPDQTGEGFLPNFLRPAQVRREERRNRERAEEILEIVNMTHMKDELAGHLSYGQQKLVELGRVLMASPRMILLDEPTAGINPTLIRQLVDIIVRLSERGIQIFLIEHNMPIMAELCERVLVMDSGSLIFSGTPGEAQEHEAVIEAYLGRRDHVA
ncbi:MAG TPA: ABC transporter ATP-binding protein [Syntrophales bacterium]|nr:ABC transporter ATP-binding protein [Syntrophales bacterium]